MIQEQTINAIIQRRDASIITLNNLTTDYFSDYKNEFSFIDSHIKKYNTVPDMETFLATFPDFAVINVNEPTNYLLEELLKDKNKRFLAENYSKVRQLIMDNKVDQAMNILKQASEESVTFTTINAVDIIHDTSRYVRYEEKLQNRDKYFINTGFPELDAVIGGWDVNEDLVNIVARSGLGKSWLLLKLAAAAAQQGKKVGIYSGEMSDDTVGFRIDTIIGHISNGALVHGGASVKNEYKKYLDELQKNVPGEMHVLTPKMIGKAASVSTLVAFKRKYNLDILFIDQSSLLVDDKGAKNPVEQASNISTDMKIAQVTEGVPFICVTQQNREKVEGDEFSTTQVSRSDKIVGDSSVIIFIERKDDLMRLHLVKSRNSADGKILTYRINLNLGTWFYIPDENNAPEQTVENSGYSVDEVF